MTAVHICAFAQVIKCATYFCTHKPLPAGKSRRFDCANVYHKNKKNEDSN